MSGNAWSSTGEKSSAALVAGDTASAQTTLSILSESNGTDWRIAVAPSTDELIAMAHTDPPSLVIVDTSRMRDANEMISSVTPWLEGTPVIAVVNDEEETDLQQQLVEAGA